MSDWRPEIGASEGAAYARIVEALSADVERGVLVQGARLPTQRALAETIGVGVGTVTRAYAEAEARGLIEAMVGRASCVAQRASMPDPDGLIRLSRNVAPIGLAAATLRGAIAALSRRGDLVQR